MEMLVEVPREEVATDYTIVDTREKLDEMIATLNQADSFSFDTETTSTNQMLADLVGLSFSDGPGRGWYVPVGHKVGQQLPLNSVIDQIRPLLESESIGKTAHNANYDMTVLSNYGVEVKGVTFDTMLAAHLNGKRAIGLKNLASDYLHEEMTNISELIGTGRKQITMDMVEIDKAAHYAAADADFTERLKAILEPDIEQKGLRKLFDTLEMPLVPVLVRMQRNGVAIDENLMSQMSVELGDQMGQIEASMYDLVGHEFNLNSSQQLGDVLFKELKLPATKRTKNGFSTDASSLEGLKDMLDEGKGGENVNPTAYQVLDHILEYRQLTKIKSTYVDSLPTLVNPRTGRIHTSYNQTGSATGRVSSNDPNVQNIPVRTELGRRVRTAFIAEHAPEWTLLGADYSQIELRILAHYSQDPGLLEAFHNNEDIHSATASSVYGVEIDGVTSDMRRIAKIMNFGVLYGLSPFGISRQTDLSPDEGSKFIEMYFSKYPGIRQYIDNVKSDVREKGYVETLLGRRRYIPEIKASNYHVRGAGERMAINMPIQGTAADIIKIAMIRIQERMDELKMRSMMIVQVHDELIFEVPRDEMEQMQAIVTELMPSAMTLDVPLNVELKHGDNWGAME
jgi:DNA polymerase-1